MSPRKYTFILISLIAFGAVIAMAHGDEDHDGEMKEHMQHMEQTRSWLKKMLGKQYDEKLPEATEKQRTQGRALFLKNCTPCHGMGGKGDGPAATALVRKPADFTDSEHSSYYSDRGRIYIITNGIPESPMAGWKGRMTDKEIRAVYSYIVTLRKKD